MTTTPEEAAGGAGRVDEAGVLEQAADLVDDIARELAPAEQAAMEHLDAPRRLLLVHAHPDDESIGNGATMARYAASGASVTLVTATRGELGEVIPEEFAHLAVDRDDLLGVHRVQELATAMEALGVKDHRFLAGPDGTGYRDSGMVWAEPGRAAVGDDVDPRSLVAADPEVVAAELAEVIREVRPQAVVTYEPGGGYGHPDHVRVHEVTHRAVELAATHPGAPWEVAKVYWTVEAEGELTAERARLRAAGVERVPAPEEALHSAVWPDLEVTTTVDAREHLDAKAAALRAHATQVVVETGPWGAVFRLSNGQGHPLTAVEHYVLVKGNCAGPFDGRHRETDLFAGIARADGADPTG